MARFTYTILSCAAPGREDDFIDWYTTNHLNDVLKMPGVVSGRLFKLDFQRVYDLDAPQWTLMTLYELECEDPTATIDAIKAASGSPAMPSTEALSKVGIVQVAGHLIAQAG
jgi:hypothetical protein